MSRTMRLDTAELSAPGDVGVAPDNGRGILSVSFRQAPRDDQETGNQPEARVPTSVPQRRSGVDSRTDHPTRFPLFAGVGSNAPGARQALQQGCDKVKGVRRGQMVPGAV